MKTKEELNQLKEEISSVGAKLAELNDEELETVTAGTNIDSERLKGILPIIFTKIAVGGTVLAQVMDANTAPLNDNAQN